MIYRSIYDSPIGKILICATDEALTGLYIEGQKRFGDGFSVTEENPVILQAKEWLNRYFEDEKPSTDEIKISADGSAFRTEVRELLRQIPYGETVTYGELAECIAKKRGIKAMSAQAVGGAVGSNPISIIVPCHRVMGKGGDLTGYNGGVDKKIKLLTLEGVDTSGFCLKGKAYNDKKYFNKKNK